MAGGLFAVPQVDFSPLASLASDIRTGYQTGQRDAGLARLAQSGNTDPAAVAAILMRTGDVQGGLNALQLARQIQNTQFQQNLETQRENRAAQGQQFQQGFQTSEAQRNQGNTEFQQRFQTSEAQRQQGNTEAQRGLTERGVVVQETPESVRALRAAGINPNSPEGQEYILRGGRQPPNLSDTAINSLSTQGGQLNNINRYIGSFRDEYGGYGNAALGEAANMIGRNIGNFTIPGIGQVGNERAAQWWQDYANHANQVRHQLYGSALTATEAQAFDRANITPGMTPQTIRANLELQRQATMSAARRLAQAHIQQGNDPQAVAAALGFSLQELGIQPRQLPGSRPQGSPQAPAGAPAGQTPPATPPAGQQAAQAPQYREGQRARMPDGSIIQFRNGEWVPAQ